MRDGQIYLGTSRRADGRVADPQYLVLKYADRHGLITGATGTGKTVSLAAVGSVVRSVAASCAVSLSEESLVH